MKLRSGKVLVPTVSGSPDTDPVQSSQKETTSWLVRLLNAEYYIAMTICVFIVLFTPVIWLYKVSTSERCGLCDIEVEPGFSNPLGYIFGIHHWIMPCCTNNPDFKFYDEIYMERMEAFIASFLM